MKKMKNKKIIIFSLLVIGIIVLIEFLLNINNSVKIKDDPELLESYNNNIEQIKQNLDLIAKPNDDESVRWYEIINKDKIEEDELKYYNRMLSVLAGYYFNATGSGMTAIGDGDSYTDSNFLKYFDGKQKMSKKEFEELMETYNWYNDDSFGSIYYYRFSCVNELRNEDVSRSLFKIAEYYTEINNKKFEDYEEVLQCELKKSELVKDLTEKLVLVFNGE